LTLGTYNCITRNSFLTTNNPTLLSHELAHGTFNLRHTFSDKAKPQLPQGTTTNLMDYTNNTELWKYQWDLIHDPESMLFSFLQDESEGAFKIGVHIDILKEALQQSLTKINGIDGNGSTYINNSFITGVVNADVFGFAADYHFDNRCNSEYIYTDYQAIIQKLISNPLETMSDGESFGTRLHNLMDFYAHTNYIEVYLEFWKQQNNTSDITILPEDIPIFEDAYKDAIFKEQFYPEMHSGAFSMLWMLSKKADYEKARLIGCEHHDQLNKDTDNSVKANYEGNGNTNVGPDNQTLFEYAKTTAIKATVNILIKKGLENSNVIIKPDEKSHK